MLQVGLQITKNKDKYLRLLDHLNKCVDDISNINFINISSQDNIINYIDNLDILHCYYIERDYFNKASSKLKWIQLGVAGVENSLIEEVIKSKVIITNSSGIHVGPVSEYVFAAILYFCKMLNEINNFKQTKNWNQWEIARNSVQLKNKTIGIIGYGNIGIEISKKAKAFGMHVIAIRRLQKKCEQKRFVDRLMPISDLSILLNESDFSVHVAELGGFLYRLNGFLVIAELGGFLYQLNGCPVIVERGGFLYHLNGFLIIAELGQFLAWFASQCLLQAFPCLINSEKQRILCAVIGLIAG